MAPSTFPRRSQPLGAYHGRDLVLRLPGDQTLRKIRWFAVWCRKFRVSAKVGLWLVRSQRFCACRPTSEI